MGTHTHTQECCKCTPGLLGRRRPTSCPNQFRGRVAAVSHQAKCPVNGAIPRRRTGLLIRNDLPTASPKPRTRKGEEFGVDRVAAFGKAHAASSAAELNNCSRRCRTFVARN